MDQLKPVFQLGQYLYQICPFQDRKKCKACDGAGVIVGNDSKAFGCPGCSGKGFVPSGCHWAAVGQGTVGQIVFTQVPKDVFVYEKEPPIQYRLHRDKWDRTGYLVSEENLFDSLEAAETGCIARSE